MTGLPAIAWIPFLEPIRGIGNAWWLLSIPLIVGISIAYKSIRAGSVERFWGQVAWFSLRVMLIMIALTIGLYVLVRIVLPALPV
ncbi:MAG: hypothetical protein FGM37_00205 [Phycisphaerales bacterium]|nr:hypothetical protein [Phycisphaerales bacterium]